MARFAFNFDIEDLKDDDGSSIHTYVNLPGEAHLEPLYHTQKPHSVHLSETILKSFEAIPEEEIIKGPASIKYISPNYLEHLLMKDECKKQLVSEYDCVPHVYEGGLKIWEGSLDLVHYLKDNTNSSLKGKRVLELGCGFGLPGLYAYIQGARVTFQDFNQEVLESCTVVNALLNANEKNEVEHDCEFIQGDWSILASILEPRAFDVILSSETIYNSQSVPHLCDLLKHSLDPQEPGFVFMVPILGIGKTTLVQKSTAYLQSHGKEVSGFYTEEVREGGKRAGFDIVTMDGKRGPLARILGGQGPRVGQYVVDVKSLEDLTLPVLTNHSNGVLIIDEVGKMECFSEKFVSSVRQAFLDAGVKILATIPVPRLHQIPLVEEIRSSPSINLITVS
ncbi:unnamed protein product, partial [Darwinula stevensoni]